MRCDVRTPPLNPRKSGKLSYRVEQEGFMEPVRIRELTEYSVEDKERAYEVYKDPKQGKRSLRRTGVLLDIPLTTVAYWNKTLGWQERLWAEDARDAALMDRTAKLRLVNELDHLLDELIDLAYHGTNNDKVRLDAIKHTLAMMSYSPIQKVQQDVTTVVEARHTIREEAVAVESLSTEDLSALLNKKLAELSAKIEE
jgi:hypothetical protein